MKTDKAVYAGIGLRIPAAIIDTIIFAGLNSLILPFENYSSISYVVSRYLWAVFAIAFNVFFLVKFGATPGKLAMKIKIVKTSLEPISYKETFLRLSVNILFSVLYLIAFTIAFKSFSYGTYRVMSYLEKAKYMGSFYPHWSNYLQTFSVVWSFGLLLSILIDKKKRALHDFIAGTLVIIRPDAYKRYGFTQPENTQS
ncbi:MAG: RDD family protein [Candidatus Ratteibacteria bacterium]|nr:RDD family protein [Candidatus Ratteibacteria bacterium]